MDRQSTDPMGDDWLFSGSFGDQMASESPYAANPFNDFTTLGSYADSPGLSVHTLAQSRLPANSGAGAHSNVLQQQSPGLQQTVSAESSSQDSASDSSSRRKRKVTSESPLSDAMTEQPLKQEEMIMELGDRHKVQAFDQTFTRPMHNLSLEQDEVMGAHFDFNSAASSPVHAREYKQNMALNVQMPASTVAGPYRHSPVQTINPGMFQLGPTRDESPGNSNMMFNSASPNAMFSTPSTENNDKFGANTWNQGVSHNPAWSNDFNNQFTSPSALTFTPSPIVNGTSPVNTTRCLAPSIGRSPLHIAPISTKSRVETQINIIMTLETPSPGVEFLHLPLHTIAKSKLLAKEEYDQNKALELHTMLVCTSAMRNPQFKEKALQRAALQDNATIQYRADQLREAVDEEKNDMKNVDEAERPANGGEVRICDNCIQRERKRAGRKKLKKEEEQQHWERFETERVVVFNSNEYLQFKPWEPTQCDSGLIEEQPYIPPEGAIQVIAAMRIACYCRHQSEKEGFRVIFTLKDQQGQVAAQQISDSILITDDHKTHPPSFPSSNPAGEGSYYQNSQFQGSGTGSGLPTSYSMVDLSQQAHPFTSSRSTGNLQSLAGAYGQSFNSQSHVHQMPQQSSGFASQTTSATMTPTSLSRPASPTSAGQAGPNKKRKSSTFHRKVPSGLTMTPRVDTSVPPSSNLPSAMSMPSSFSPSHSSGMNNAADQGYMTIPNNSASAQYFGSGPPTPSDNAQYAFNQVQIDNLTRAQNAQAYFSHPSSRVPSRASSPVLQTSRPNMAAYGRHPIQTPTNSMQSRPQAIYGAPQAGPGMVSGDIEQLQEQLQGTPTITKITPAEGPTSGGTEVSIYGYNFTNGMQVMFGEQLATTVFYGNQALLATSPPSRPGGVNVTLVLPAGNNQYPSPSSHRQIFTYTQTNPRIMEMALRFLSQQQTGSQVQWNQFSNEVANQYVQTQGQSGMRGGPGYDGGNMMASAPAYQEDDTNRSLNVKNVGVQNLVRSVISQSKGYDAPLTVLNSATSRTVSATLCSSRADLGRPNNFKLMNQTHATTQRRTESAQVLTHRRPVFTMADVEISPSLDLLRSGVFEHVSLTRCDTPYSGSFQLALRSTIRASDVIKMAKERRVQGSKMIEVLDQQPVTHCADTLTAIMELWTSFEPQESRQIGAFEAIYMWVLMPTFLVTTSTLMNLIASRDFQEATTATTATTLALDDISAITEANSVSR